MDRDSDTIGVGDVFTVEGCTYVVTGIDGDQLMIHPRAGADGSLRFPKPGEATERHRAAIVEYLGGKTVRGYVPAAPT